MEEQAKELEARLSAIELRNRRVEKDKAWECSLTRRLGILLITYALTAAVFYSIGVEDFLLNALIPTLGYGLSTISLRYLRQFWEKQS